MEKDKAQETTLEIEGKIYSFYPETSGYKTAIKILYKAIKVVLVYASEYLGSLIISERSYCYPLNGSYSLQQIDC